MDEYQALSHTTWDCKYHVVFIPKCRRKTLYAELRSKRCTAPTCHCWAVSAMILRYARRS